MKRNILLTLLIFLVVSVTFVYSYRMNVTDAEKFKKEYESLNNTVNENGKKYRKLDLPKKNPIVYATSSEIIEKMDNKETFAIYFGFSKCPWCRSVISTLFEVASDLDIDTIYYVDVLDIRNTLEVIDGKVTETKKGSKDYYKLLEKLDNVLADYSLVDENDREVDAKQKRIYAPNIVAVVSGKAQNLTEGISDSQDDAYMKLTSKMKKDMYNKIKCTLECLDDKKTTCTKNAC